LQDLLAILGNRQIVVGRELTKKFEEVLRGQLEEIIAHFAANAPRGEFTLVVAGAAPEAAAPKAVTDEFLTEARALIAKGVSIKEAAKEIAATRSISRRLLYNALQKDSEKTP